MKIYLTFGLLASWQGAQAFVAPRSNLGASTMMYMSSTEVPPAKASSSSKDEDEAQGLGLAKLVPDFDGHNKDLLIQMEGMLRKAQLSITKAIADIDGSGQAFQEDTWVRDTGGGGASMVLAGGKVWEKAGVNLSVVHGTMPAVALRAATERQLSGEEHVRFSACGLSCVMHPRNPHCPTMHFNYRLFQTEGGNWWFGGGTDITPSFIDEEDMKHFHGTYKKVCDRHDPKYYDEFKAWADEYFLIKHREERRGLGGIFFDDQNDRDPQKLFDFCEDAVNNVVNAYGPIIIKNKDKPFTEEEKRWQQLRRGRYAEFNLVYDRGTIFGLKTGGRIESILMSLPETARWEYDHHPEAGSKEADFLDACMNPRCWV